ncbi:MAG: lipid-A-disaccharide synthase [Candidatus Aminicenantes bacterium]|nr:lipid-A-disaccharide synthase [Candidatus Aminicenantes bacterium]
MKSILITACESSAEKYGAELAREFKKLYPEVHFFGIGGKQMQKQGTELLYPMQKLSLIGIFEVFLYIPRILKILNKTIKETKKRNTAGAVLIDAPDFNLRIARKLKRQSIPVLYYVSPTIWAWRKNRLKTIKKYINKMMLIFPFEEKIYKEKQIPAVFIGHPLIKKTRTSMTKQDFFEKYGINNKKRLITLLPGSRKSEIRNHLPVLVEAAKKIKTKYDCQFILKLSENIERKDVAKYLSSLLSSVTILSQDGCESMAYSDLVLSSCGTANLETALLGTPLISFYKLSPLSYHMGRRMVKIEHFSIVNILAGKKVIPELIQKDFNPDSVYDHVSKILDSAEVRNKMISKFRKIKKELGEKDAAANAAKELEQLIFPHASAASDFH